MLSKLQTNRGVSWVFAPQLCGKALPFRPKAPIFLLICAAGRLRLPAAQMRCIDGTNIGKAEPFRTASGEAAGHPSIARSNLDKPGQRPPLQRVMPIFSHLRSLSAQRAAKPLDIIQSPALIWTSARQTRPGVAPPGGSAPNLLPNAGEGPSDFPAGGGFRARSYEGAGPFDL